MASITNRKNGSKAIQFVAPDGTRKTVTLGKASKRTAETLKFRIEQLLTAAMTNDTIDRDTARWVSELDSRMADKLANVGLIASRERATLAAFIDGYIAKRTDVKGSTATVYGHTRRNLVEFFGADKPLRDITPGDADEFCLYLLEQGLAGDSTVRRRCGIAKQYFTAAKRKGLVDSNPFADLKAAVQANTSRFYFVTRDEADKVLEACPDSQWRLLFALGRYGGLRCPSEHLSLRWGDVDWERGRIEVRSPKTEHHAGGESRMIPLFPELRPHLEECFDLAEPGTEYVISICRNSGKNFRTRMERIIKRAGLQPWPKLFQNLRSTRETELAEQFPMHVVCAWIGNSQAVAAKHYLQTTDEHFEKALHMRCSKSQNGPASTRKSNVANAENPSKHSVSRGFATAKMGDEGLEPPTSTV